MNSPTFSQSTSWFTRHRVGGPTITFPPTAASAKVAPERAVGRLLTATAVTLLSLGLRSGRTIG